MGVDVHQCHIGLDRLDADLANFDQTVVPLRDPLLCLITHDHRGRVFPSRDMWLTLIRSELWEPTYFPVEYMGEEANSSGAYVLKAAYYAKDWGPLEPLIERLITMPDLLAFYRRHGYPLEWE